MNAGEIVASLKLKVNDFQRGIKEAQDSVDKFKKRWENASKDFKAVGTAMTAVGTGIGIGLGGAVKTAADFEKAMSRVGALSGATEKELKELTEEARRLGSSTAFSASQAAEGMQYLAMAGFDANQIIKAMGGMLDMAAAGQIGLGDAANIATNIMSGFNLEASKSAYVADVLTKTFTNSNTTLIGLGETMKYVAPAAASVGWTLEEMAAAAAKLGDVGIDASMAGTSLRAAVTRLASPTGKAKQILKDFNIKTTDAKGRMLPLADILEQMRDKFKNLSEAERAAAVQTVFGTEAMSAMLALMQDPEGLKQFTNDLKAAGGTAQEIAEKQMDNLHGVVEELGGAFEEVQISLGNALIPTLRALATGLTNVINWFNSLPDGVKSTIATFLALSSVLLIVGGAVLLFIGFIPNMVAGFKALKTVLGGVKLAVSAVGKSFIWLFTNPIGWLILGIAALVAAIVLIWKNWDTVKEWTIKTWNVIKAALSVAWEWIKDVFQKFLDWVTNTWETAWGAIKDFFVGIWEGIKETFITVWNYIWDFLSTILAIIYALLATAWELIVALAEWIWSYIGDYIIGIWEGIKSAAETIWNAIAGFFTTIFTAIKDFFVETWESISSFLKQIWEEIEAVATVVWEAVSTFFENQLDRVKNFFVNIWTSIKAFLFPIWNSIKSVATSVFNALKNTLTNIWNNVKSVVINVWNGIKGTLTSIWNSIKNVASTVWNAITGVISNALNNVSERVSSATSFIKNMFTEAINKVKEVFSGLWDAIKKPIDKVVNGIKEKVEKAKEYLSNLNPFKRHSPSLVDNVKAGVKVIRDTYAKVADMRIEPPTIGNLSAGRLNIEAAFAGSVGNGGGTTYNAPLVNVENMNVRDESDIRGISRELFNLQRSHDRARGGR